MNCTKCGREHTENSVFCAKCLEVMKKYPVKPGTVIQLPQRNPSLAKKAAPRRKAAPLEELVTQQRKTIKWLCVALLCTILLLGLSIALLFHFSQEEAIQVTIGQNYITKDPAAGN